MFLTQHLRDTAYAVSLFCAPKIFMSLFIAKIYTNHKKCDIITMSYCIRGYYAVVGDRLDGVTPKPQLRHKLIGRYINGKQL